MTRLEDPTGIENVVGAKRHEVKHIGRAISAEQRVYILHSKTCRASTPDLRDCAFSLALDNGIDVEDWCGFEDRPVVLEIDPDGALVPWPVGSHRADAHDDYDTAALQVQLDRTARRDAR